MQCFLGDTESERLNIENHCLALTIVKKTLDENLFKTTQKTMDRNPSYLQLGDRVYFKNKQPGKWDLKWRPRYRVVSIECNGHYLYTKKSSYGKTRTCNINDIVHEPPIKFWNIDTQFGRARKYINHLTNLPTITLSNLR